MSDQVPNNQSRKRKEITFTELQQEFNFLKIRQALLEQCAALTRQIEQLELIRNDPNQLAQFIKQESKPSDREILLSIDSSLKKLVLMHRV
ncbi:hypothetical protein [Limnobacter alexandrii]|uniref:hypothetical protein n=1 Tax=Limnobacter alexandrii TaxID=2570352 RepID=UPI0011094C0E|nr:hypothetical protein [Limnobacter alexandrii]